MRSHLVSKHDSSLEASTLSFRTRGDLSLSGLLKSTNWSINLLKSSSTSEQTSVSSVNDDSEADVVGAPMADLAAIACEENRHRDREAHFFLQLGVSYCLCLSVVLLVDDGDQAL